VNTIALLHDTSLLKNTSTKQSTESKASTFASLLLQTAEGETSIGIVNSTDNTEQDPETLKNIVFDSEAFADFLNSEEGSSWLKELHEFLELYITDEKNNLEGSSENSLIKSINEFVNKDVDLIDELKQIEDFQTEDLEELESIIMNLLFEIPINLNEENEIVINIPELDLVEDLQNDDINQKQSEGLSTLKPILEELIKAGVLKQESIEEKALDVLQMNNNWNQFISINTLYANEQSLTHLDQDDQHKLQNLNHLITKIQEIFVELDQSSTKKDIQKQSGKLLQLLDTWKQLTQDASPNVKKAAKELEEVLPKNIKTIFESFEKRQQIVNKKAYNATASVTSSDVSKWIESALSKEQTVQQVSNSGVQHMQMSKVEQYMIHLQTGEQNEEVQSKELLRQFSKILESSRFMNLNQANRQMTIHLRPNNLGDMVVKMSELNGEMLVKLIVQSGDAKKMLESNLHQLKHMFSPHQVMIEKQETLLFTNQTTLNGEHEEQNQNLQDETNQNSDQQNNASEEKSFEDVFDEALMNEKV